MRKRISAGLTVILCGVAGAPAWGQPGPEIYRGMTHLPIGAATLSPCADCLEVGNIGAAGADGVCVDPGNAAEDLTITFDMGPSGALPTGGEMHIEAIAGGMALPSPLSVTISETGGGLASLAADFSSFSPPGVRLELLLDSVVVHTVDLAPPYPATLLTGALGTVGLDGHMSIDGGYAIPTSSTQAPYMRIKLSRVIITSVSSGPGGPIVANEIRVIMTGMPVGLTKPPIDALEMTATNLGQFTLHDERLIKFGNPHLALGQALLSANTNGLQIDDLGTGGGDGVQVDPDPAGRVIVQFPTLPTLEEIIFTFKKIGAQQGNNSVRTSSLLLNGIPGGGGLAMDTDFADYGAISRYVEVLSGGVSIASMTGQIGPVGETSNPPDACIIWDIQDGCNAGGTNLELHLIWTAPTMLDINGLGTFVADEMIIQPELARGDPDRPLIVGRIYSFSVTGSNIASMTIGDEIVIPVPPCVDTDGDMLVGTSDLLGLLAAWGSSDPAYDIAPAGGDGVVGTQDLLLLLAEWGPCPIE